MLWTVASLDIYCTYIYGKGGVVISMFFGCALRTRNFYKLNQQFKK